MIGQELIMLDVINTLNFSLVKLLALSVATMSGNCIITNCKCFPE